MKAAIAKEWTEALRSGEYTQGTDVLRHRGKFCCLGVLCDIYRLNTSGDWDGIRFEASDGSASDIELPSAVRVWAGMQSSNPGNPLGVGPSTLSCMNDEGMTFLEIADIIDNHHDKF